MKYNRISRPCQHYHDELLRSITVSVLVNTSIMSYYLLRSFTVLAAFSDASIVKVVHI